MRDAPPWVRAAPSVFAMSPPSPASATPTFEGDPWPDAGVAVGAVVVSRSDALAIHAALDAAVATATTASTHAPAEVASRLPRQVHTIALYNDEVLIDGWVLYDRDDGALELMDRVTSEVGAASRRYVVARLAHDARGWRVEEISQVIAHRRPTA